MSREILILCGVILIGVAVYNHIYNSWEYHGPGMLVVEEPVQRKIRQKPILVQDFKIVPKAEFRIKARVLAKQNYKLGIEAKLSPMDLVLGWGPMSDDDVLSQVKITQDDRWYFVNYNRAPPIPHRQLLRHSGNMHMLPASEEIFKELNRVGRGQVVEIAGYLVNVYRKDGWKWYTSLSRNDTGAGSCEVVWVEEFEILDQ